MHEAFAELGVNLRSKSVLDFGFGSGDLLASFPHDCAIHGAEISNSAIESALQDPRFRTYAESRFSRVYEEAPESLPSGPFDIIIASHVLEHVTDDRAWVRALRNRLRPGGLLVVFLPVEEPGYNPDHVRVYDVGASVELLNRAGLRVIYAEGGLHLNGHLWKVLSYPSRRRWPVLGDVVNTLRLASQAIIPYPATRHIERLAASLGCGPRQAFVIGKRVASTTL
jgi:SAM-dependent methyltransferase